ncbi:unnamed protein product [Closterium sp. NIES-65]|nr:unnamed protein product [Closterium sp. NIES-65]
MKRRNPTAIGPAPSYCNRAYTIRVELLTIGQEVHMATFAAHVLKGLPPKYGFLRRKLEISSPDMTVERVCSEVLMEEQTLSIAQRYKQITSDASAFSGAVITIVATTGVNGKEGKRGREQTDKKKDGKNIQWYTAAKKKDGSARNGATAAAACNGTAAASACTDMAGGAVSNGRGAASACNGTAAAAACTDMAGGAMAPTAFA